MTIIAASGEDANAGLSGVGQSSRRPSGAQQVVEVVPRGEGNLGMALVIKCNSPKPPYENEFDSSHWNTRGWIYQERSLSRRCLIFTQSQVYWACDGATFCEESRFEHPQLFEKAELDTPLRVEMLHSTDILLSWKTIDGMLAQRTRKRETDWIRLLTSISIFSSRNLGLQGDVCDAFHGIEEAFERTSGEAFLWGHPRSRFELSLLWEREWSAMKSLHRRTEKTTRKMTSFHQRVILPSWSWMGWVGPVRMDVEVDDDKLEMSTGKSTTSPLPPEQPSCDVL